MRYILIIPLLIGTVAFAEQGVRPDPTGCPSGDSIPIESDKCDHTIKATANYPTYEPVKTLPSVGAKTIPQNK